MRCRFIRILRVFLKNKAIEIGRLARATLLYGLFTITVISVVGGIVCGFIWADKHFTIFAPITFSWLFLVTGVLILLVVWIVDNWREATTEIEGEL